MDLRKAVVGGVLIWALITIELSLLLFKLRITDLYFYYAFHFIIVCIFVILSSMFYFTELHLENHKRVKAGKEKNEIKVGFYEGLRVGIIFALVAFFLDALITVNLFYNTYRAYFLDASIILGYFVIIFVTGFVSWLKQKSK